MRYLRHVCASLCAVIWAGQPMALASDTAQTAQICRTTGAMAAQRTGVPVEVLHAITLTETGRRQNGRFDPWPWTVNMEGVGKWFATREEATAFAKAHFDRGARSFDVGCFQINYRWHGNAFASIEDMFDPQQNAMYAGRFLRELYGETGSWPKSAGAYHSRTPKFANKYRARFERILARLSGGPLPPPAPVELAAQVVAKDPEPTAPPPPPWNPPPPTRFGSVAAVDALPGAQPLLIAPTRRLY